MKAVCVILVISAMLLMWSKTSDGFSLGSRKLLLSPIQREKRDVFPSHEQKQGVMFSGVFRRRRAAAERTDLTDMSPEEREKRGVDWWSLTVEIPRDDRQKRSSEEVERLTRGAVWSRISDMTREDRQKRGLHWDDDGK